MVDTPGEVNLALKKTVAGKEVKLEWQLANALDDEPLEEEYDPENPDAEPPTNAPATDFTITLTNVEGEGGISLYCNTYGPMADEAEDGDDAPATPAPFAIGAVKVWQTAAERDSPVSYNGPEYEDFPATLQASLNEFIIGEVGVTESVISFIDATAVDKEQREYMRWLETMKAFVAK